MSIKNPDQNGSLRRQQKDKRPLTAKNIHQHCILIRKNPLGCCTRMGFKYIGEAGYEYKKFLLLTRYGEVQKTNLTSIYCFNLHNVDILFIQGNI